jgi:hypothetical protein
MIPNKTALDGIFSRIEETHGIAMRSNFLCCQSCGHAALEQDHLQYGFYHVQDMEHAAKDGKLYLAFSTEDEDDVQTAETIVEALREEGCTVEWNGTSGKRIVVDVDGPTFDLYNTDNIPQDAERISAAYGLTLRVWLNPNPTREVETWELRIVGEGENMVWHVDAHETREEAITLGHGVVETLDLDDEDEDTNEEE